MGNQNEWKMRQPMHGRYISEVMDDEMREDVAEELRSVADDLEDGELLLSEPFRLSYHGYSPTIREIELSYYDSRDRERTVEIR